jgi:hypothetical protein
MIALALAMLLQADGQAGGGRPVAPIIRYRDKQGIIGVTSTPSNIPVGATILEITSSNDYTEIELKPIPTPPTHEELVALMEEGLKEKTRDEWRAFDAAMRSARLSGDSHEPLRKLDGMFIRALWGNGLWALPLAPFLVIAICLLLAWWLCIGLSMRAKAAVWIAFSVSGLLLSHLCLHKVLYRPQSKRLDLMLALMPYYLGGDVSLKPETRQALLEQAELVVIDSSALNPVWTFPIEVISTRHTLRHAVQEATGSSYSQQTSE